MKTIVLTNQKGGVGKSAVARLMAHYLVSQGYKTLCLDMDMQANFTYPLRLSNKATIAESGASQVMTIGELDLPKGDLVLVPSDGDLLTDLEKRESLRNDYATNFRRFLVQQDEIFDVCVIDTAPSPDIRMLSALTSTDYVVAPIQLNQEAISGIGGVMKSKKIGTHRIKATINPKLELIGILPNMVERTSPFQVQNFKDIAAAYGSLLIPLPGKNGGYAHIPKRSIIAEAQATGEVLWEMKKTSAADTWREIKPSIAAIVARMNLEKHDG